MEGLGHYQLRSELGRGGMGVVYKAYEPSLNRYVAIKVLARTLAHDEPVKERFLREARSMAALNDPHIIQIFFIGEDAGQTYFVMELVDGVSLSALIKQEGKLSTEQAAKVIYQAACGLAVAHDSGVIHRDIKPANLMVTSRGAIKIADFGIALTTQDFSRKLTSSGEFVGTPGYLSPEVCLNKPVDQRSDIFALGVVLFECLTGRMPFKDDSPLGLMLEVVNADIPDVRAINTQVDPELSRILSKMIAKNPADRYQNCRDLMVELGSHSLVAGGAVIPMPYIVTSAPVLGRNNTIGTSDPVLPPTAVTLRQVGTQLRARSQATPGDALILPDLGPSRPQVVRTAKATSRAGIGRAAALAAISIGLVAVSASAYLGRSTLFGAPVAISASSVNTNPDPPNSAAVAGIKGESPNNYDSKIAASDARALSSDEQKTAAVLTSLEDKNEVPDDALWLSDVPDEFLSANALGSLTNETPPLAFQLAQTNGVFTRPYVGPPPTWQVGSDPGMWHVGLNAGYGFGWFGDGMPRQIYIGPLRQVAFVGLRSPLNSDVVGLPILHESITSGPAVPTSQNPQEIKAPPPVRRELMRNVLMSRVLANSKSSTTPMQTVASRDMSVRDAYRRAITSANRAERYSVEQPGTRLAERSQVHHAALSQSRQRSTLVRPKLPGYFEASARIEKRHP